MKKEWKITPRAKDDLIDQLLTDRGITDHDAFLKPDYRALYDPFRLKQMDILVERISLALRNKERIGIFGDYDHDGTPAAALLADGLTAIGADVALTYIPSREEGYSLSRDSIDLFVKEGIKLLITVDCGITNKSEIDYALQQGIETIVIDHHVVQADKFPSQAIVINPKQAGDSYPFKELCGCGLVFKVMQALAQSTGKISVAKLKWYLDLVAISTICDMVPLVDENRILVHYGLIVLRQTRRLGLQKLFEAAAIDPSKIDSYTVGFGIGPRLNAPGRIDRASIAYELLVSTDEKEASRLARNLNELNGERQNELERVLKEAQAQVEARKLHERKVILIAGEGWTEGVVGLVAGRLMDKYHRPTLVLASRKDGLAKGSARSFGEFHLVEALQECESSLVKYGGHARAAGLTLAKENLEVVYDKLIALADLRLDEAALRPTLTIDAVLAANEVSLSVAKQIQKLEPYGYGHHRPLLLVSNVQITESRVIGESKKHLKLKGRVEGKREIEMIAFGMADRASEAMVGTSIDIAGMLDVNEWQGQMSVQFKVVDWKRQEI